MSNVQNNGNNQNQKKEPLRIRVDEFERFSPIQEMGIKQTSQLAKRINKLFNSVFADYHGSAIFINPGNGNVNGPQVAVELFFKPISAGSIPADEKRYRAFAALDEPKDNNRILNGLMQFNALRNNLKFEMTEEGCEILSEFIMDGFNVDPFNAKTFMRHVQEFQDTQGYMNMPGPILIKTINIDLSKLLRKIYGTKMEDGSKADYAIIPLGPVNPMALQGNGASNPYLNWRLQIVRANREEVQNLATEMGAIFVGKSPIVTGF